MIRAIVFDLFDTLVDQNHHRLAPVEIDGRRYGATTPALHAQARDAFEVDLALGDFSDRMREVDRALRPETIDQGIELSTLDRFTALGTHLGVGEVLDFGQALTETHMGALYAACTVPEHHEAVLTALAVDHPLALCSNFSHAETARNVLRDAGFDRHLQAVVISEEVGIRKPRREIFDSVVEAIDCAPEELLHVGDNLDADVAGAAAVARRRCGSRVGCGIPMQRSRPTGGAPGLRDQRPDGPPGAGGAPVPEWWLTWAVDTDTSVCQWMEPGCTSWKSAISAWNAVPSSRCMS